jgi:hypothetical protein
MLLQAVSVLVIYIAMNEGPRLRWDHIPYRYVALAMFLIPTVLQAVILPLTIVLQGGVQWQEWLTPRPDGLYQTPAARGWGAVTFQGLLERPCSMPSLGWQLHPFMAAVRGTRLSSPVAFRLQDRMGIRRAVVVTAISFGPWGMCHNSPAPSTSMACLW